MNPTEQGCAVVTGASRGIGAATARALADAGWAVAVNYNADAAAASSVVDAITATGGRALAVQADVSDRVAVDAMFEHVEEQLGTVLVLVNNAGVARDALMAQIEDEEWDEVLGVNLSGTFWTTRRAVRAMLRRRFGRIVNVTSLSGIRGVAGQSNYGAAKAGLVGLTMTTAVEVAKRGITVNAVAPGLIETDMTREILASGSAAAERIPARRLGTVDDVAGCIRFLASTEASYITGAVVPIDGGISALAI